MKFLILKTKNPYYNLAVEEYLFEKTQDDVFILWQNEPTVVIGKNQNVNAEIDFDFVNERKIHVARRITGGGAVYHDLGNVNYSFISAQGKEGIDFAYFTKPIIDALNSLGACAKLTGRNDIEIDGKKISGNAQYSKNGRTLHHGTLLFDADLTVLSKALHVDEEKIKSKAIKSARARVTNLKSLIPIKTVDEFIGRISDYVIKKYSPEIIETPIDDYIDELEKRNASDDWIFPKSSYLSSYTARKKKKYDFGLVEIELSICKKTISEIKIYGDFFGTKNVDELADIIKGKDIFEIEKALHSVNVSEYILGMTSEELIDFIKRG